MLQAEHYFAVDDEFSRRLFEGTSHVWDVLAQLERHVARLVGDRQTILGRLMDGAHLSDRPVYLAEGATVEPGAYVLGPAYIGPGAVVRQGALVRENVILGEGCVLGHASEAKNSLFLPWAAAPHFNYVGDSILGRRVNLGAGTKLSNLTLASRRDPVTGRRPTIQLVIGDQTVDTGLSKLGAILGDGVQTGCNAVLNPGCLVGPNTLVYPNVSLPKGYYPANIIIKLRQHIEQVKKT
jgi:UDP-N-acetylglucosamine diphosphorylase / glucose-1-phosphate thymidylyltransferase / UDP-N-acetylgalactosamine diphosphorylase / glucosamine-1-phosphate N-acetyltransferase / galactosamine-1-phosphate N-acetyltransferase